MGASESTGRSNGTEKEEEECRQEPGGGSTGAAAAIAVAAAGAAVAAWGVSRMLSDNTNTQDGVFYQPPFQGHFKMNTDGACRPSGYVRTDHTERVMRGPSGYGGILRDHRGSWVRGFRGFLGVTDCLTAEFHGIHKGLLLLDKLCVQEAVLESDSAAAIEWINHDETLYRRRGAIIENCWDVIKDCKRLIKKNRITTHCCSRDANKCADKLANMGIDNPQEPYKEIIHLPVEIRNIIDR